MKRVVVFLFLACTILFSNNIYGQNCLVASYPFNGNAQDTSGNGHHGTVAGAKLANDKDGNPLSAYEFDGIDDFISIPHDTAFDFEFNDDFTITFWVNLPQSQKHLENTSNDIIDKWQGTAGTYKFPFAIRVYNQTASGLNGILRFTRRDLMACNNSMESNPSMTVNDSMFHHLAMVKNNTTLLMFIDGVCVDSIQDSSACNTANGHELTFGRRSGNVSANFTKCTLDEINIYRCALNKTEIAKLYNPATGLETFVDRPLKLNLYPNPSNGSLNINWEKPINGELDILNSLGELVHRQKIAGQDNAFLKLNSNYSDGIYYVVFRSGLHMQSTKFILQKN